MRVVILGGGISGLGAAYFWLKKHPNAHITLLEKSGRLGGWMATQEVDGFLFERGPRTFPRERSPHLLEMIRSLGLEKELVHSEPKTTTRYLWHEGQLKPLSAFWFTMLRAACKSLVAPQSQTSDESIYEFGCHRFGKRATELLLDPMAKGIFAGDIRKLSRKSCFSSPKVSAKGLFTLRSGMQTLVEALGRLPMSVHLHTSVEELRPEGVVAAGKFFPADWVVAALPAPETSRLTGTALHIRYEPLSVVNLGFHGPILPHRGYGYLVPSSEREPLLGMIWDSALFPTSHQTKVSAMVQGVDPLAVALRAMRLHLGVHAPPVATLVTHAEIPQYDVGHGKRIKEFEERMCRQWPRVKVVGNYVRGASVEGCLMQATTSLPLVF